MPEYAFDIGLAGALRVSADSEEAARKLLASRIDAAAVTFGPEFGYTPMEVSLRGRPALFEVDGQEVDEATQVLNAIDQLSRFALESLIDGVDGVGCNDEAREDDMKKLVYAHYLTGRIKAEEILED